MGCTVRFAAVALAALTLAACQSNGGAPSAISGSTTTASPHPAGSSGTTPSGSVVSPKSNQLLTTRAAQTALEGRDYTTLYTTDPHGESGARVGVQAIREDGSAVIVNSPLAGPGKFLTQSQVGIQKGQSRTWFPPQTGSQPRQAIQVVAHGESIVWLETKSTDLFYQDWKMYAARVGQRQPTLLGDSFDLVKSDEIPYPPGVKITTTDGVHAWWVMVYRVKSQRGWDARIMVRDLAGREPLTVAVDKAKLPAATAGGVAYVRSKDVDSSVLANRYEIRLRRAGTDTLITSGPLAKEEQVSTICASGTLLAWAVRSPSSPRENPAALTRGSLHVMTLATKVQRTIKLDDNAGGLSLDCGETFIAWGNGSGNGDPGQYVLDMSSGKIWKLGELKGISAVLASGTILAWALPPKSAQEAAPWRVTKWHGL